MSPDILRKMCQGIASERDEFSLPPMQHGRRLSLPARCVECCGGLTAYYWNKKNDEREKRGEDPIPIPGVVSQTLVQCANAKSSPNDCAGMPEKFLFCRHCGNLNIDGRPPLAKCMQCDRILCLPCREANEMDQVLYCSGCESNYCGTCAPVRICSSCEGGFCEKMCKANIYDLCTSCDRIVCADCDPKYNTEHSLCGKCYKPCTNPDCSKLTDTKRCGACRTTRYCGKECQVAMWPKHREECPRIKKEKEDRRTEAKAKRRAAKKVDTAPSAANPLNS